MQGLEPLFATRIACPLCGGETAVLRTIPYADPLLFGPLTERYGAHLSPTDLAGASYTIRSCGACDFLFQQEVPTDALAWKLYSYTGEEKRQHSLAKRERMGLGQSLRLSVMVAKMGALAGSAPADTPVLEFGMGWGHFSSMARSFSFLVLGIEISKERQARATALALPFVDSIEALGERTFAVVHSDQVFEHLADPLGMLRALAAHLRPGGIAYLAVPDGNPSRARVTGGSYNPFGKDLYPLEHVNCFSTRALTILGQRAGLTLVPPARVARRCLSLASLRNNASFAQEAFKAFYSQRFSTALYFTKP